MCKRPGLVMPDYARIMQQDKKRTKRTRRSNTDAEKRHRKEIMVIGWGY